jgi:hypothetical protein
VIALLGAVGVIAAFCGCYSTTVTFTGTDEVWFAELNDEGERVEFSTPMVESRSYTKKYLLPPKGFMGDVLDNPEFLQNLLRQTWLMRQPLKPLDEFTMPVPEHEEGGT